MGVPVRIVRLDDVLPDCNVDWVKIDVQGWEAEVLRGMEQTLRKNPSTRLYFEFWPTGLRHAAEDPAALLDWLDDLGLSIYHPGGSVPLSKEEVLRLTGTRFRNFVAASRQHPGR